MRIAGTIVGIILVLLGGVWIAQGSNLMAGSAMSGQSMWLWIGVVVAVIGLVALVWANRRR
jgi:nucleoside recognition membrane protein YjiH